MQRAQLQFEANFHIVAGNDRSQAAAMVLAAGDATGGPDNRHATSDQWLFVVEGSGQAIVEQKSHDLTQGTLLLIERGEAHEIKNTGNGYLRTLNFYVPPAYDAQQATEADRD